MTKWFWRQTQALRVWWTMVLVSVLLVLALLGFALR